MNKTTTTESIHTIGDKDTYTMENNICMYVCMQ